MKCNSKSKNDGFPAKFYAKTEKKMHFMKNAKFHPIGKVHEREVCLSLIILPLVQTRSEFAKGLIGNDICYKSSDRSAKGCG